MNITLSKEIKNKINNLHLGCIFAEIKIEQLNTELWTHILEECEKIKSVIKSIDEINKIPTIKDTRVAYKKTGKDPSRYRPSAESLLRRIVSGKELYQINNVVDIVNLISIKSGFSIGGYDIEKISGDIVFDIGRIDDDYEGVGRGKLNIEGLPVFRDSLSAFGCPTSDSVRTSVTNSTNKFLMVIISFNGKDYLEEYIDKSIYLLQKYANAKEITINII